MYKFTNNRVYAITQNNLQLSMNLNSSQVYQDNWFLEVL